MKVRVLIGVAACTLVLVGSASGQSKNLIITAAAGKHDYQNTPVCVPLSLPKSLAKVESAAFWENKPGGPFVFFGQLTRPGITTEAIKPSENGLVRRDLHFIIPALPAGQSASWKCAIQVRELMAPPLTFSWEDTRGEHADLLAREAAPPRWRPVLRYMYKAYDNSSPEKRDQTYKVFHHLFDPTGERLVTNGGNTDANIADPKKLLYPHHRGLMYAFNRITYDDNKHADTWHAKPGDTHEEHVKFLDVEAGPVLGRHRVLIDWHGPKNEVFAKEERELTVYNKSAGNLLPPPGGTLVEFASRLKTTDGKVILDGDPQHAGFQFRAANAVAEKTEKQTYFLRPDGKGKPNQTRNWDPKTRKGPVNLPWDAMCFVLDGKRYTLAYLNNAANPGEQRYSERAYGRIGCYFKYELTKEHPLVVRYRVWLQEGEMTVPQVQALSTAFVGPPRVTVK